MLMGKLALSIATYLCAQIEAGAQAVQLFDSWVGALAPREYDENVFVYSKMIFDAVAELDAPRIHFGVNTAMLLERMRAAGADVMGIDWRVPLAHARARLRGVALQGNLDPALLLTTPELVACHTRAVLHDTGCEHGYIFNLGHGLVPETRIENVERLIEVVHGESNRSPLDGVWHTADARRN